MNLKGKMMSAGLVSAVAASLCCITPLLALLAGTSGLATAFTWLEPARPYLIGFTLLVLGYAWYQNLRPAQKEDCHCEPGQHMRFTQGKTFMFIVTCFTALMLALPMYAHIFYPKTDRQVITVDKTLQRTTEFTIRGMTCSSCEEHIDHEVNKLSGILSTSVSYKNGNATITFDSSQTTPSEIEAAINATGYIVTDRKVH